MFRLQVQFGILFSLVRHWDLGLTICVDDVAIDNVHVHIDHHQIEAP